MFLSFALLACQRREIVLLPSREEVSFQAVSTFSKAAFSGSIDTQMREAIDWTSGDQIEVFCAEARGNTTATFDVSPSGLLSPAGEPMRWGNAHTHSFYALYPASSSALADSSFSASIPADQTFDEAVPAGGYYGDMSQCFMAAAVRASLYDNTPVMLPLNPVVTIFEVTVYNNYSDNTPMNLRRISLSSATHALTGTFNAALSTSGAHVFTFLNGQNYSPAPVRTAENSVISFDWNGAPIEKGGSVTVALFALPLNISRLTLRIETDEGVSSLDLKDGDDAWLTFDRCRKHNLTNLKVPVWDYSIDVSSSSLEYDYSGGTLPIYVSSTKTTRDGSVTVPTPWKAQYFDGISWVDLSESLPDWLEDGFPTDDVPTGTGFSCHYASMPAQSIISHEDWLRMNPVSGRVDLSRWDIVSRTAGPRTTANTYVVSGPGQYSIPMVYGCAVDNLCYGTDDRTISYNPSGAYADYLDQFRNHFELGVLGLAETRARIKKPWISEDTNFGANCTQAGVLWQDFNNGSTDVISIDGISEDDSDPAHKMINFTVSAENISPGNAVIYVMDTDKNVIAWSWQIWITAQSLTPIDIRNAEAGASFTIQPVNLGWADDSFGLYYPERIGRLRLVPLEHESSYTEITLTQHDHEMESTSGHGPWYQWGRKDPLLNGTLQWTSTLTNPHPFNAIREPTMFIAWRAPLTSTYDWTYNDYRNLWDATNTTYTKTATPGTKTVYDPCPRGYMMVPGATWDGLSTSGSTVLEGKGRFFPTGYGDASFFLPADGYISTDGTITGLGMDGCYWTDRPAAAADRYAFNMHFTESAAASNSSGHRAHAYSVRCLQISNS